MNIRNEIDRPTYASSQVSREFCIICSEITSGMQMHRMEREMHSCQLECVETGFTYQRYDISHTDSIHHSKDENVAIHIRHS